MKNEPPFDHYLNTGPASEEYKRGYTAGYSTARKYYKSNSGSWEGCIDTAGGAFTEWEKENANKW